MWGKHGDIALLNPQRAATQFLESVSTDTIYYILLVCLFDCFCIGFLLLLFCIFF